MANISSINGILGGSGANYDSLMGKASGVHNRGEIVFKKGYFGGFGRINYHVGLFSGLNTVITTAEQNRTTKAAVFKAILDKYDDVQADHGGILNQDLDTEEGLNAISEYLQRDGKNPYLKEAFNFLLGGENGSDPLSRDEMKMLDTLLKIGRGEHVALEEGVDASVKALENLKCVKLDRVDGMGEADIKSALDWVQGLKVSNSEDEETLMLTQTVNGRYWKDDNSDHRRVVERDRHIVNAIDNNIVAAPKLPEPYKTKGGKLVTPKVTEDQINKLVDRLIHGLDGKAMQAMMNWNKNHRQSAWVNELDCRDVIVKSVKMNFFRKYPEQAKIFKRKEVRELLGEKMLKRTIERSEDAQGLRTLKEDVLIALMGNKLDYKLIYDPRTKQDDFEIAVFIDD